MKECFKCHRALPLNEFYKHPQMSDGHLGKCKPCTRKDVRDREEVKRATDLDWVLNERKRHREKAEKARESGTATVSNHILRSLRHAAKYPEKTLARTTLGNAIRDGRIKRQPCERCGKRAQGHHDDYSKPLEVRWLCVKHHAEHHVNENDKKIANKFYERH